MYQIALMKKKIKITFLDSVISSYCNYTTLDKVLYSTNRVFLVLIRENNYKTLVDEIASIKRNISSMEKNHVGFREATLVKMADLLK